MKKSLATLLTMNTVIIRLPFNMDMMYLDQMNPSMDLSLCWLTFSNMGSTVARIAMNIDKIASWLLKNSKKNLVQIKSEMYDKIIWR